MERAAGVLQEGETELAEMHFGAQLASCTLAGSIRFPGFTRSCLLSQYARFYPQGVDKQHPGPVLRSCWLCVSLSPSFSSSWPPVELAH